MNRQDLVQNINKTLDALGEADELWKSPLVVDGKEYNPQEALLGKNGTINIELYPLFDPLKSEAIETLNVTLETAESIANNLIAVLSTYTKEDEDQGRLIDNVNDLVQLNNGEVKIMWGKHSSPVAFLGFDTMPGLDGYAYASFDFNDNEHNENVQLIVHLAEIVTIANSVLDAVDLRALVKSYREDPKPIF